MAQETAVSWLVNELPQVDWSDPHWVAKLEQAKAMEKEQILDAFDSGLDYDYDDSDTYYNKTYTNGL